MTNALAQNIETDKTNAIDILMQSVNVSSNTKTQEDTTSKFSNLMNNLDARTQKAQKDFNQKAKVTNTSSINQKALEKKNTTTQVVTSKNTNKEIKNDFEKSSETKTVNNNQEKKVAQKTFNTTDTKENNTIVEKENKSNTTVENKTETTNNSEKLSDINNSSPVETSPVFSSKETQTTQENIDFNLEENSEKIEENIQELIEIIPVINENNQSQIQDLKVKIEDLISSIEKNQELKETVEKIETTLNNSDLNQNKNEDILNALKEIKELFNSAVENLETKNDFNKNLIEIKNQIQELTQNLSTKTNENKETDSTDNQISLENDTENKIIKELNTIETSIKNTQNLKEIAQEIEKFVEEFNNAIKSNDSEKITQLQEEISTTIENIKTYNKENKIDLKENISKILENLQKNIFEKPEIKNEDNIELNNEIIEVDFSKNIDLNQNETLNVIEKLDNLAKEDFKNIDITKKESMNEILETLQNLQEIIPTQESDTQIKAEIEALIKNINENAIDTKQLTQAIDDLSKEIKTEFEKEETVSLNSENTIDITSEFEKFNENQQNQNHFNKNQNVPRENQPLNEKEIDLNVDDFKNIDVDIEAQEVNLKAKASQNVDIKNIEQNLQKAIYTQEIMEEMMVEVNVKTIPTQSGALSVADEVAKLAIGESNALNPVTSAHGSVTYDSTGTNAIIKNAASLMKATQPQNTQTPSMDDILNQIGDKITQLKDGSAQKLTMVLRPNDLGRLSIELTQNQNGLTTYIMAQNEDVRAYIERNIDSLRQQLTDAGVNVNNIQIKTAGQEGSTQYDGNQNLAREQQENLEQQNNKNNKNSQQQNQNNNKDTNEILTAMSNYDMQFAKDFSSILNKSLSYGVN